MTNTEVLILEMVNLKTNMDREKKRLEEIHDALASETAFPEGKSTGHLLGAGYDVTVQLKQNVKWDQKALNACRAAMGDEKFFSLFSWKYEPADARKLSGFLAFDSSPHRLMVEKARIVSAGKPSVTFKPVMQQGEA